MRQFEKIVPLACIGISFLFLSPFGVIKLSVPVILLIHFISYLGLGLLFELPELSLNALCLFLMRDKNNCSKHQDLIARILNIRYYLTHYVGPVTGIMAITSGLYLTVVAGYSFQESWIFWIVITSALGLFKGMYQHNAYIRRLISCCRDPQMTGAQLRPMILDRFNQTLIFLEFPTYIFSFWAASFKPKWPNPFKGEIQYLEQHGSVWIAGMFILLTGCLWLIPLRYGMKHLSPVFKTITRR